MLNRPALSGASSVLLIAMAVQPLPAADHIDPNDGWSIATARPLEETVRQVADRTYNGGISQPQSATNTGRRPRPRPVRKPRSKHTDREQRIALGKLAVEPTSGNPLREASPPDAIPPEPTEWDTGQRTDRAVEIAHDSDAVDSAGLVQPASLAMDTRPMTPLVPSEYDAFMPSAIDHAQYDTQNSVTTTSYAEPYFEPGAPCACEPACGVEYSCDVGCATGVGPLSAPTAPSWAIGYELVLVKPRFENNVALTMMESDGAQAESFSDFEFDYDRDASTRLWMDYELASGFGGRAIYWHFDELPTTVSASPPANGFGFILHPEFGDIDISTNVPTDTFTARSTIEVFSVDLEMTRSLVAGAWTAVFSGGLRYAEIEQSYVAQRHAQDGTLLGEIDFAHHLKGIGPTIAMQAARPLIGTLQAFSTVRGSLLFGDGEARLAAIEGAPTDPPLVTNRTSGRDDLLPIGEMQAGLFWEYPTARNAVFQPFLMAAMEAQVWGGAGNAASEDGSVGFFGATLGGGMAW